MTPSQNLNDNTPLSHCRAVSFVCKWETLNEGVAVGEDLARKATILSVLLGPGASPPSSPHGDATGST